MSLDENRLKERIATYAVEKYIVSGMKLGLGTGSTALPAIRHIGKLLQGGQLKAIKAVPTSFQSLIACEEQGIPVYSLNSPEIDGQLDLAIDGADEIDPQKRLIKGGGGALLLEKIVAYNSNTFIVIADSRKLVEKLGPGFPIPIEVVPEARLSVVKRLIDLGGLPELRQALRKAGPVITDKGNIIIDTKFPNAPSPEELEAHLAGIPGIVESGLFTGIRPTCCISYPDGRIEDL